MPYTKTNWTEATPITVNALNNMEAGIERAYSLVEASSSLNQANAIVKRDGNGYFQTNTVQVLNRYEAQGADGIVRNIGKIASHGGVDLGDSGTSSTICSNVAPKWWNGSNSYTIYTNGNKPTPNELGAVATAQRIPKNSNLNNYTTEGFYYCQSNADAGTISNVASSVAFSLLVERHVGCKQTFTTYDPKSVKTWIRNYYNNTWGPWQRVMDATSIREGNMDLGNRKIVNLQAVGNRGYEYLAEDTLGNVLLNGAGKSIRLGSANTDYIRLYKSTVNHYSSLSIVTDDVAPASKNADGEPTEVNTPITTSLVNEFVGNVPQTTRATVDDVASVYVDTGEGLAVDTTLLITMLMRRVLDLEARIALLENN